MGNKSKEENKLSRRNILPILGSALLVPFLGFGKSTFKEAPLDDNESEYRTLLKSDGTTVKVKVSTLKNSKIIQKKVSNKKLFSWLQPNSKTKI